MHRRLPIDSSILFRQRKARFSMCRSAVVQGQKTAEIARTDQMQRQRRRSGIWQAMGCSIRYNTTRNVGREQSESAITFGLLQCGRNQLCLGQSHAGVPLRKSATFCAGSAGYLLSMRCAQRTRSNELDRPRITTEKSMICEQSNVRAEQQSAPVSPDHTTKLPANRATYPFSGFEVDAHQVSQVFVGHARYGRRESSASLDPGQRHAHQHGIDEQMKNAAEHD